MGARERDFETVLAFLDNLGGIDDPDALMSSALESIHHVIPYDLHGMLFLVREPGSIVWQMATGQSVEDRWVDDFHDHYAGVIPDGFSERVFHAPGYIDWNEMDGTEYVNDFIWPQHIRTSAWICITGADSLPARVMAIHRSRHEPAFTERDQLVLKLLRRHLQGLFLLCDTIGTLRRELPTKTELAAAHPWLSPREAEVASLLCTRLTVPQMAIRLDISPRTVETHVEHIYWKLGVRRRGEAAAALRRTRGLEET